MSIQDLNIEELAKELETSNCEKLIKALFLFEKSLTMKDLTLSQKEIILDEAYEFYTNQKFISSFLQEDINKVLEKAIDRELSKQNKEAK
ncbi:hypothetical protein ACMU1B_001644 [Campylobacter jejuni]|uniref:hypothetical protein n=1 Tax=Campylobacter TaxID=194 RepID=UPI00073E00DB|nr:MULTISPECIES: hypothetical protein [Campylobacter]ALW49328.1 hypothetical protein RC01_04840 [Campylobacter jejuni]ALW65302.1 hypothetical protein RC32_04775 [Campylobacter jejuni]ALW69240.1 hypothetical protein RC06_08690 [Campylobacter jejuni]EAK8099002.1 hypothetical protein [Campylobacter jejuni]EAL0578656.1 hypothetical protein [Campylobacter jejuni]